MLSYQHIYHAGSFADIHKHLLLIRTLTALQRKEGGLAYFETHAGRGQYDLDSVKANKTGEYRQGIGRLWPSRSRDDYADYLHLIEAMNPHGYSTFPGSPMLARRLLRRQDRAILMELHPAEHEALHKLFRHDSRVNVHRRDGYEGLAALVPPKERRGLVLIDPSYEIKEEYQTLVTPLKAAYRRWPQGTYLIWYPLLPEGHHHELLAQLAASGIRKIQYSEIEVRPQPPDRGIYGSGMIAINPPWPLSEVWSATNHDLSELLADQSAVDRCEWLVPE